MPLEEKPAKAEIIDAAETPERKLDNPNGSAEVLDINGTDRLMLTGKIKSLKIGSVNGEAVIDATRLEAEEIILAGSLNGSTSIKLNTSGGKVRIVRQVGGAVRLSIHAPGGEVLFAGEEDAGLTGGSMIDVTAKRLDIQCLMNGGTKLDATLATGGSLRTGLMDGGAAVRYKPASGNDSDLQIETGELRGGASVKAAK